MAGSQKFNTIKFIQIIFLSACLYLYFILIYSNHIADYDLWGYLAFGRIFWEDGYFPYQDIFSYTPTKPLWVYHEWLTGILFYPIYKNTGPAGLQLFRYVIIILTIYLIYLTALKKGAGPISALLSLVPAMLLISFGYVPVRAQVFTYLFFILTIYILESANKDKKWTILWWLVPVIIFWCNLHGGFISGLGLIFLYALGEKISKRETLPYLKVGIISSIATLVNPYGPYYWSYLVQAILMSRPEIDEWLSVMAALQIKYQDFPIFVFIILSAILIFALILTKEKNLTDLLLIGITILLGYKSVRHTIFSGLIYGAFLPPMLTKAWSSWKERKFFLTRPSWIPWISPLALLIFIYIWINPKMTLIAAPNFTILTPSSHFPVGAIKWIKENNWRGNILPHFDWGEFLIWTCAPFCRVAMDGRYETIYKEEVCREYFDFLAGRENWKIFLQKYPHDIVLIKANTKTHLLMLQEPSWRLAYAEKECVLFVRRK
ncbi:MAG: hypothetical protein ACP5Q3_08830 [bacterium]